LTGGKVALHPMPGKQASAKPGIERESFIVDDNEILRYSTALLKPKTNAGCENLNRIRKTKFVVEIGIEENCSRSPSPHSRLSNRNH